MRPCSRTWCLSYRMEKNFLLNIKIIRYMAIMRVGWIAI